MADNSSGIGVLNVIIAALIVLVVGGTILYTTGTISPQQVSTLSLPKTSSK